jgi:anti-sigma B factor antagonist
MSIRKRMVSVHQIPSDVSSTSQMELLRRLAMSAENGHPRFVLDCSKVETMGSSEVRFLLSCLEEVMKHNGDVRLAVLNPEAQAVMKKTCMHRLFETYPTTESAVQSYQFRPSSLAPLYADVADMDVARKAA